MRDACEVTNMGLMGLPWNVIFLCFTIFFQVVFVPVISSRVIFCLFMLRCDQRRFSVHRSPANSRCYWRLLASLFNDEPAIGFWSVEPVIEQVQFSSSHAVHPKEAASLGKVRRLGQHIGWFCKIILFKDGCYSATTLSSMISVEIF